MPEIIIYGEPERGALLRALDEIARDVGAGDSKYDESKSETKALCNRPRKLDFSTAEVTDLITTGLGGLNDEFAAGFTARNGNFTWTVRWDWDPDKGEHVNLMIKGPYGTDKFAFLSQPEKRMHDGENLSAFTLNRFTSDCQWSKDTYDSLPGTEKVPYRKLCAAIGRKALAVRILEMDMPEVECGPSLSRLLYKVNMS